MESLFLICELENLCGAPIPQLIVHNIHNLMVTGLSPALGTRGNGPPIHQVAYGQSWHYCCLTSAYSGSSVNASQGVEMVQECTGPVSG